MRNPFKKVAPTEQSLPSVNKSFITDALDITKFYAGYSFQATNQILIRQPTVGEIIEFGEQEYYKIVYALTSIPSDRISELWDMGIDFNKVPDIEFFFTYAKEIKKEQSKILFGDLIDFTRFEIGYLDEEQVVFDRENEIIIDNNAYSRITQFLCDIHQIKKERVSAAGRLALMGLIEVDRQEKAALHRGNKSTQVLFPLLSSMENSPGFKYTVEEALKLPIFRFMDSVKRISLITSVNQLAIGHYTGSFDQQKFRAEKQLNWMRDLYN